MLPLSPHLTEAELYDLLDEPAMKAAHAHLQSCLACREEVLRMQSTLSALTSGLTAYAEAQPLRRPDLMPRRAVAPWAVPALAAAGVAALALLLGQAHSASRRPSAPVNVEQQVSNSQNLSDEALLNGINQDLSTPVPPSLAPLGRVTESGERTSSRQQ